MPLVRTRSGQRSPVRKASLQEITEGLPLLLSTMIGRSERRIQEELIAAVERLRERMPQEELATLVRERSLLTALSRLAPEATEEDLAPFGELLEKALVDAAIRAGEEGQTVMGPSGQAVSIRADDYIDQIRAYGRRVGQIKVREIGDDVRDTVAAVIRDAQFGGGNEWTIAGRVRDAVGLTTRQERAVQNYRRLLEEQNREALDRELRDRRYDPSVRRASSRDGEPLSAEKIDRMVQRYRDRFLRYRAGVIGRTEATRATQGGVHRLYEQYIQSGRLRVEQVRRYWVHNDDGRVRNSHLLVPMMNPEGVGLNEEFKTMYGGLLFPGDPGGRPEDTINCRCVVDIRVRDLTEDEQGQRRIDEDDRGFAGRPTPERDHLQESFALAPSPMIRGINSVRPATSVKEGEPGTVSAYDQLRGIIYINAEPGNDLARAGHFRHEYGHHVDRQMGMGANARTVLYRSGVAVEELRDDGQDLLDSMTSRLAIQSREYDLPYSKIRAAEQRAAEAYDAVHREIKESSLEEAFLRRGLAAEDVDALYGGGLISGSGGGVPRASLFLAAWDTKDHGTLLAQLPGMLQTPIRDGSPFAALSDAVEASTGGLIRYGYGHGMGYYAKRLKNVEASPYFASIDGHSIPLSEFNTAQAFADWFDVEGSGDRAAAALFRRLLPRTTEAFDRILEEGG